MTVQIPRTKLIDFIESLPADQSYSFESLEKEYGELQNINAIVKAIETCVNFPRIQKISRNLAQSNLQVFLDTYVPSICFGRLRGHTTALAQYIDTVAKFSLDFLVVCYNESHVAYLKTLATSPAFILTIDELKNRSDLSTFKHIIFDGRITLYTALEQGVDPSFLQTVNVITVGV